MKRKRKLPLSVIIAALWLLLMIGSVFVIHASIHVGVKEKVNDSELVLNSMSSKLEYAVNSRLLNLHTLEVLVYHDGGMMCDFDRHGAYIYEKDPAVRCIQLAPNGVITNVYPLEGNENSFGNLFVNNIRKAEAYHAKISGEMTLGGPYELHQGGIGVVARRPIYLQADDGEWFYWGFAIEVLDLPLLLESAQINDLSSSGFSYRLWHYDGSSGEPVVFAGEEDLPDVPLTAEIPVPGGKWYMSLVPTAGWFTASTMMSGMTIFTVFNFLTLVLAFLFLKLHKAKKRFEAISLIDDLTGLYNTRAFYSAIGELDKNKEPFFLYYLDLNKFKSINDIYGHNAGNKVLHIFAKRIFDAAARDTDLYRIGGDEFAVVLKGEDQALAAAYRDKLAAASDAPYSFDGLVLEISSSCGYACYPRESSNIDQILRLAENRMYEEKARHSQPVAINSRTAFFNALKGLILEQLSQDEKQNFYFYHIDFKAFKLINYMYDSANGNELIGRCISFINSLPECLLCSRGYADQIFFVTRESKDLDQQAISDKFWHYYCRFIDEEQQKYPDILLSCNCGVSLILGTDIAAAAGCANIGRMLSRKEFSPRPIFVDAQAAAEYMKQAYIKSGILSRVANKDVWYEIQPILSLPTGEMVALEVLGRLSDRSGKTIYPNDFIPLLIRSDAIVDYDLAILEKVCRDIRERQDEGKSVVPVNVNLSPVDICKPDIAGLVFDIMERWGIQPDLIRIEITENVIINDMEKALAFCEQMHARGIKIIMDDFGSGYMNFEYLSKLPIDIIKIDKSIIAQQNSALIGKIIAIAHELRLPIVCEGVETKEQYELLLNSGMKYAQGYYFCKPQKPEIFNENDFKPWIEPDKRSK